MDIQTSSNIKKNIPKGHHLSFIELILLYTNDKFYVMKIKYIMYKVQD
jgi:hypothetical protein